MATLPASDVNVRKTLDVFQHFSSREGDVLTSNNFLAIGINNRWNIKDLQSGIKLAVEKGLVEVTDAGQLRLTKSGFAEM